MENASKALIIAGAILLSILIISLGIMIFNQASGVVNNNSMSEVEISAFNQKFTQYEGSNVRGTQVNAMMNALVQNNIANQEDKSKQVELVLNGVDDQIQRLSDGPICGTLTNVPAKALTGKTYSVECGYNNKTGLVNKVTVSKAK